jgi:hypothetical protein
MGHHEAGPGGWSTTGLKFSNTNNLRFLQSSNGVFEELPFATLTLEDQFTSIAASEHHQVLVLESANTSSVGFGAPESFIRSVASQWKVPGTFLQRILGPGSLSRLDYVIESTPSNDSHQALSAISIGFRWGAGHSNHIIAFGRLDLSNAHLRLFLSSRDILDVQFFGTPKPLRAAQEAVVAAAEPWRHPLDLFGLLLLRCEKYVDLISQESNIEMLQLGRSLDSFYSPYMTQWTTRWNISPRNDSPRKIDALFGVYNDVTWGQKGCTELLDICQRYQQLTDLLETKYALTLPRDFVDEASHRIGMHGHFYNYLEKAIETQFTHQYHYFAQKDAEATLQIADASRQIAEATRQDSSSMKTVAYLTLAFLPITAVCAFFSTSIMNFQNFGDADHPDRVVSSGWWIFLLCCILATVITLGTWLLLVKKLKLRPCFNRW